MNISNILMKLQTNLSQSPLQSFHKRKDWQESKKFHRKTSGREETNVSNNSVF